MTNKLKEEVMALPAGSFADDLVSRQQVLALIDAHQEQHDAGVDGVESAVEKAMQIGNQEGVSKESVARLAIDYYIAACRRPQPVPSEEVVEHARMIMRVAEMSAGIMRDSRRTGGWEGSKKVADQFDRIHERASIVYAALQQGGGQ